MYRVPATTYRLQFNAGFTFRDAEKISAYLADLGTARAEVELPWIYASPIYAQ